MLQPIDRSFIGEGQPFARLYGSQDGLLPFGNCDAFSVSYATDRKALPNYMGGGGNRNVRTRPTDVTGSIQLPEGTEMVMPGDQTTIKVELGKPIAMEEGLRFAVREGGRTVASGRVTKINK